MSRRPSMLCPALAVAFAATLPNLAVGAELERLPAPASDTGSPGLPSNWPASISPLPVASIDEALPMAAESAGQALGNIVYTFANLLLPIPDNSAAGVTYEPTVSSGAYPIHSVRVDLKITSRDPAAPMFNGDLLVTLRHETGYAVLLNRVGRRDGSSIGYADNGFQIRLEDAAAADVHTYRTTVTGSDLLPISDAVPGAPLTGSWQPDARAADPESVLSSTPRTANLAGFQGLMPSGQWTLFIADLSPGGLAQLDSWTLDLVVVPEIEATASVVAGTLAATVLIRRRRKSRAKT